MTNYEMASIALSIFALLGSLGASYYAEQAHRVSLFTQRQAIYQAYISLNSYMFQMAESAELEVVKQWAFALGKHPTHVFDIILGGHLQDYYDLAFKVAMAPKMNKSANQIAQVEVWLDQLKSLEDEIKQPLEYALRVGG